MQTEITLRANLVIPINVNLSGKYNQYDIITRSY